MLISELSVQADHGFVDMRTDDPLRQPDALLEAQLLDVRFEALTSTASLLFDLRTAMQIDDGNTGVLLARGLREIEWSGEIRSTARTAWNVVGSDCSRSGESVVLRIGFLPSARIRIMASRFEFYVGDVAELLEQLPDYGEDDDNAIRQNLPSWDSSLQIAWSSQAEAIAL
ncbi:hypothetical protein F4553_000003 [Allocatelliglobosispora scoriae]|uniref:Uncharacterized protein n=1 Tax=Allocatelliglobosispora scoriae TaxID=643052 RepID=A0A841BEB1_9ACTN|nr:hypothetical protein [Allocatelliglobosispora scoriae]MBB5866624.1 hypothetical protein [Allocatelliglobosispora scoriae]